LHKKAVDKTVPIGYNIKVQNHGFKAEKYLCSEVNIMEDNIIILEDDQGNQVEFAVIDVYEFNENTYFAMVEVVEAGQDESDEVLIMKVDNPESEDAELIVVDDEAELQAAFDEFLRRDEEAAE
jgi:hypothetical protein